VQAAKEQHNEPANPKRSRRAVPNPDDLDPPINQADDQGIHNCRPADAGLAREGDEAFTLKNGLGQVVDGGGARRGEYRAPLYVSGRAARV
jgi:hypothetical protein